MAAAHIYWDETNQYGRRLRASLQAMESADDQQQDAREMLIQMRDGDGSQDAHYDNVVRRLGYGGYTASQGTPTVAQLQMARASFEEFDSAFSKTSGNGSVTNVRAARDQVFAKHRG